jgi:ribosomal protein S18 acetylase RimI-like enzyme
MLTYHPAQPTDFKAIAKLHANSWQNSYRNILSDDYLDNKVEAERLEVWTKRFKEATDNQHIITAKHNEQLCGFACIYTNDQAEYGSLIDNLHVAKAWQGNGIGKQLMLEAAKWLKQQNLEGKGMYLWVYDSNDAAKQFYERIGGQQIEVILEPYAIGGGERHPIARYFWEAPISVG